MLPHGAVAVYSRDEAKHWTIRNELAVGELAQKLKDLQFYVGDVRDGRRVRDAIRQFCPDVIIVAAALKQVDTCELSPYESVMTNLLGTQNIIDAVNGDPGSRPFEGKVLFVSTDKACSPVNVYGMCKALSERLVSSQERTGSCFAQFMAVRYGNVLESRGSIIPLFKYQGEHADALTVTDPEMTRFLMTLDSSVDLIQHALALGTAGETWVPILPSMRIGDLAQIFSERYGKPIKVIGLRPGEKLHEDLINETESCRTLTHGYPTKTHHVILPARRAGRGNSDRFTYCSSGSVMSKDALQEHLRLLGVLDAPLESFKGLTIEEIVTNRSV